VGQEPGPSWIISGCMGQVYIVSLVLGLVLVPSPYHKQDNRPLHHILYRLRKTWG
jgi:hypothetical protein